MSCLKLHYTLRLLHSETRYVSALKGAEGKYPGVPTVVMI